MVVIRKVWQCLSSKPLAVEWFRLHRSTSFHHNRIQIAGFHQNPILIQGFRQSKPAINANFIATSRGFSSPIGRSRASWLMGLGNKRKVIDLPVIVKAGDPVLHEPAREVSPEEIGSDRIQKIIDDMVQVMRKRPGVGLAAPQIGIPLKPFFIKFISHIEGGSMENTKKKKLKNTLGALHPDGMHKCIQIIVLEDTKEYIAAAPEEENKAQDRRPFDLLVILNPKLKKKGNKSALFFEGCLSVDGYRAMVDRFLEVEVRGLDRNGKPLKVDASGWQARILQHECDHLDGILYVDKMVKRTFRVIENLDLPLAKSCPNQGVH